MPPRKTLIAAAWCLIIGAIQAAEPVAPNYLEMVRTYGRSLLTRARPLENARASQSQTGIWPVQATLNGLPTEFDSRANLLHDTENLRLFRVLSEVSDDGSFRLASNAYITDYFVHGQHEQSGLLAWGPHLFIDLKQQNVVTAGDKPWHELLPRTTPWEAMWDIDPKATARAVEALEMHFYDPADAYFAQRVPYDATKRADSGHPRAADSGLMTHAFAFLYHKTGQQRWLNRARQCSGLFWKKRRGDTGLVPVKLGNKDDESPATAEQMLLAYFLLKAWKEVPHETVWGERAVALIKSYDRYAYDAKSNNWRVALQLDGTPAEPMQRDEPPVRQPVLAVWKHPADDTPPVAMIGRVAAYASGVTGDRACLGIATRAWKRLKDTRRTGDSSTLTVGMAIGLSLDLYDLTKEQKYLDFAKALAEGAVKDFWTGEWFVARPGQKIYDARMGTADLAAALLRLHLRIHKFRPARLHDWTF